MRPHRTPNAPHSSKALACPNCAAQAAETSRFCAQCGTRLGAAQSAEVLAGTGERLRRHGFGERRQVTVLFCDLVDSTALAARLDPEEMCELMSVYQAICAEAIAPFEGYIAQTLGDGLLVYFGYPEAHEDDAERATRAGLAITTAVADPEGILRRTWGPCAVRVGIHTGLVVAGEIGQWDTRADMAIIGQTPNIAARLQQFAGENQVVIGAKTRRLVEGYFQLRALGPQPIKGLTEPLPIWQVRRETRPDTRFAARSRSAEAPLVGRESELQSLLERWRVVCAGGGQLVTISGAAGIGKSRLLEALHAEIKHEAPYRLQFQCSPFFQNTALYPLVVQFQYAARIHPQDSSRQKLRKLKRLLAPASNRLERETALMARLLQIPGWSAYDSAELSPERLLEDTLDVLIEQLLRLAELRPVLLVLEDTHWIDPTTLNLIARLRRRLPEARILAVVTHRPDWRPPHTFQENVSALTLERLGREHSQSIVRHLSETHRLPVRVTDEIIARGDGIPLFIEELTKAVMESDANHAPLRVPASLQDSLTARLDHLGPLKFVAQLGACIGRTFQYELLASIAQLDEVSLREGLDRLVVAELLSQRGEFPQASFTFRHALLQNAAYDSMLRAERRVMHAAIARCLVSEQRHGIEHAPEVVAQHLTAADDHQGALEYWLRAGQLAQRRSAHAEAIAHLTAGVKSLRELPQTVAVQTCEIDFHNALARSHMAREGWSGAHVSRAYKSARELARATGNRQKECEALWGVWANRAVAGALAPASSQADDYVQLAEALQDRGATLMAHSAALISHFSLGEFERAQSHADLIHAAYLVELDRGLVHVFNHDPVAIASMFEGWWLGLMGYPERAGRAIKHSVEHARRLHHPFQLCYALVNGAGAWLAQGDDEMALAYLDEGLQLASEQRIPMFPIYAPLVAAPALIARDPSHAQLGKLRQCREKLRQFEIQLHVPSYLLNLALAHEHMGQLDEAAALVDEGLELGNATRECWVEPELLRTRARLLALAGGSAAGPDAGAAEHWLRAAIDSARVRGARMLELRSACDLAEIWQRQGRSQQARELLEPRYQGFDEGFQTRDLRRARQLLGG